MCFPACGSSTSIPVDPPDAVMDPSDVLDLVECGVEAMRSLLDASPLDADELENIAELFAYEVIIEDEVMGVVDLADEAVASTVGRATGPLRLVVASTPFPGSDATPTPAGAARSCASRSAPTSAGRGPASDVKGRLPRVVFV